MKSIRKSLRLEGIQTSLPLWLIKTERELISYNFCIQVKIITVLDFIASKHGLATHAAHLMLWQVTRRQWW